jgi:hypothetical protein
MADGDKYYVWSPIHYHNDEGRQILPVGEQVTQDSIGVDDETWDAWLEGGVVRASPYPKKVTPGLSPNEHRLRVLREKREELEREIAGVGGVAGDTTESPQQGSAANA